MGCYNAKPRFEQAVNKEELIAMLEEEKKHFIKNYENEGEKNESVKKLIGQDMLASIDFIINHLNHRSYKTELEMKDFTNLKKNLTVFFDSYHEFNESEFLLYYRKLEANMKKK